MKRILLILIASLSLSLNAQSWHTTNWGRAAGIIAYHVGTVAIGAVGDAMYDEGNKEWGHALKAAEVGMLIGGPFIFHVQRSEAINYILSYGFIRFSMFDGFYNMTRDLPLLYNGTTSGYDKFMSQIPPHGRAWYKSCSLIVGFAIPIKEL